MKFHKVKEVTPLADYTLSVLFEDNTRKKYDVKPLFEEWDVFKNLYEIKGLFNQVKVDMGGYGIVWNEDIDLSCNELCEGGTVCQ